MTPSPPLQHLPHASHPDNKDEKRQEGHSMLHPDNNNETTGRPFYVTSGQQQRDNRKAAGVSGGGDGIQGAPPTSF